MEIKEYILTLLLSSFDEGNRFKSESILFMPVKFDNSDSKLNRKVNKINEIILFTTILRVEDIV